MLLFLIISFFFVNGLSLMDHVARWPAIFERHNVAGAATSMGLNVTDPTFVPRWLLMFGLALGTTAAWIIFDAEWFARRTTNDNYRRWAWRFAPRLYAFAMIWFAAAGSWYVFGTWSEELRDAMLVKPLLYLTGATAVAMGVPCVVLFAAEQWCPAKWRSAALVAFLQFCVLGLNAASRQTVQNLNLLNPHNWKKPYLDILHQTVADPIEQSPLWMFLIVFVLGLAVIGWMLWQVRKCSLKSDPS